MKKYIVFSFLIMVFILIAGCEQSNSISISPTQTIQAKNTPSNTPTIQPTLSVRSIEWEYLSTKNIGNLEQVDQWGKGYVTGVDITEDGSMIAVAASTGVYLYDTNTMQETLLFEAKDYKKKYVHAIAFSPDGQYLAVAKEGILIWNLNKNEVEKYISNLISQNTISRIEYSNSGNELITMGRGGPANCDGWGGFFQIYNIEFGKQTYYRNYCPESSIYFLNATNNKKVFFTGINPDLPDYDYETTVVDANNANEIDQIVTDFHERIYDVNLDGTQIIQGEYQEGTLYSKIIDLQSRNVIQQFEGHLLFTTEKNHYYIQENKQGFSGWSIIDTYNNTICSMDDSGKQLSINVEPYQSYFRQRGKFMITISSWYHDIQIWDSTNCKLLYSIPFYFPENNPTFSTDGKYFVTGSVYYLHVWDPATGEIIASTNGSAHVGPNTIFSINSKTDEVINSIRGENKSYLNFENVQTGKITHQEIYDTYEKPDDLLISPDGSVLATLRNGIITFWNPNTHQILYKTKDYSMVSFLENGFNPDSSKFAFLCSQNEETALLILDIKTGNMIEKRSPINENFIAISPNWKYIAGSDNNQNIFLRNFVNLMVKQTLIGQDITGEDNIYISHLVFSPDSTLLISSTYRNQVRIWSVETGKLLVEISPEYGINNLAFNPDQHSIAAISRDGTIKIFAVPSENEE